MKIPCTLTAIFTASLMANAFNYFPEAFNKSAAASSGNVSMAFNLPAKTPSQRGFKQMIEDTALSVDGIRKLR